MWFVLSLLAGLLFAANRLIVRNSLSKNINIFTFGAIHEILAGLILLPLALFQFSFPQSSETFIFLALGILFIFLTDLFTFLCLRNIEATLYQMIGQLRHIVVLLGAFLFLSETLTFTKVISILLIIIGVYIALSVKSKIKITKGVLYAFISTVCISIAFLFIKQTTPDVAPSVSASMSLFVSGIIMYLLLLIKGGKNRALSLKGSYKSLIIAGIIFAIFELTQFSALSIGQASLVTPVSQSSMIFTLIGGYMFLKERDYLKQKIIGGVLITAGIISLYFI